jgi:glycosyltransferase involved in cell wall biosynthesis
LLSFISIFNLIIFIIFTVFYSYQIFYVFVALLSKSKNYNASINHKYAVVIAARNESAVIAQLINSIKKQNYPGELLDIYVVADNCTDDTAAVAKQAGARVFERFNKQLVGKGYALDYAFKNILKSNKYYEGYFVFDADNLLDENYVSEMNKVFDKGYKIITSYRNSKNYDTNWLSAGYSLWFLREAKYLNNSRMLLNTGCAISGTVFLDEIAELPMEVQPKLLRFLDERKFKRVGGLEDIEVDIRIIAATNKNLEKAIEDKEFREDLYYRLNVVPVYLPLLRERGDDILILANNFLYEYNCKFNKKIKGFTDRAKEALLLYSWKGNVRELKNVIERIVILVEGEYIDIGDLPLEIRSALGGGNEFSKPRQDEMSSKLLSGDFSLEDEVAEMEADYIKLALKYCSNNHTKAAEMLGISRFAFKRRIEKYFYADNNA